MSTYRDEREDIIALMRRAAQSDMIRAVIREPLGLTGYPLPPLLAWPPGTCRVCHLGPLDENADLCTYCQELEDLSSSRQTPFLPYLAFMAFILAISALFPFLVTWTFR